MTNCDAVYTERDRCISLIAKLAQERGWITGIRTHVGLWEDDWRNIIFIDLPTGQISWHIHDSELPLFHFLPRYEKDWDGHTTDEKYARVAAYNALQGTWEAP